ncbi:hypothetical protein P6P90_17220 [Ectobacillus antri]|uniref:Small, acid-soluble spore protein, SspJ family n=1 Tax=Ectobacillus antri TaxID=2486280 RepID=A0ABT6HAB1_9BACI|nr:hypothetical protein [Ectobacillus antri]MDG4658500.1 hypothetical protein [Ectobacillus antri]MDG5755630.1 hypothetical protein [Ectobacillus antri]
MNQNKGSLQRFGGNVKAGAKKADSEFAREMQANAERDQLIKQSKHK